MLPNPSLLTLGTFLERADGRVRFRRFLLDGERVVGPGRADDHEPASLTQSITSGQNLNLTVVATGTAPLTYQWSVNGTAIAGATSASYPITNAQSTNAGSYTDTVTNSVSSVTSNPAVLTFAPPAFSVEPRTVTAVVGASATFTVTVTGTPITYQWFFNGTAITGATSASYVLNPVVAANAGNYTVTATDPAGTNTSSIGSLLVYSPYVVKTLAGAPLATASTDGPVASARFFNPEGLAVDAAGNIFVADTANSVIRMITPAGVVSTLAGTAGVVGSANGTGPAAQFEVIPPGSRWTARTISMSPTPSIPPSEKSPSAAS